MTIFAEVLNTLDKSGWRPLIAAAASALRWGTGRGIQRFSVDQNGNWVNCQPEATVVSPTIHTSSFEAYRAVVIDHSTFQYRPREGDTVVDIGAGVGEDAIIFSKLVGDMGRVISIEASPATFACLKETIRRSSIKNVTIISCAITDLDGPVAINESDNHITSSIIDGATGCIVDGRTLDSLTAELHLGQIDLLKMNIEGAEIGAVRGMKQIAKNVRYVVISCHDFIANGGGSPQFRTFEEVRKSLDTLGFDISTRTDHINPWTRYYVYGRNRAFA